MQKSYGDLYSLLKQDPEAGRYFDSLPGYVKDAVGQRAQSVTSMENLRDYVENLTREDE